MVDKRFKINKVPELTCIINTCTYCNSEDKTYPEGYSNPFAYYATTYTNNNHENQIDCIKALCKQVSDISYELESLKSSLRKIC